MDATQQGCIRRDIPESQRYVLFAGFLFFEAVDSELTPLGGQCRRCYKLYCQQTFLLRPSGTSVNKNYNRLNTQGGHYTC